MVFTLLVFQHLFCVYQLSYFVGYHMELNTFYVLPLCLLFLLLQWLLPKSLWCNCNSSLNQVFVCNYVAYFSYKYLSLLLFRILCFFVFIIRANFVTFSHMRSCFNSNLYILLLRGELVFNQKMAGVTLIATSG